MDWEVRKWMDFVISFGGPYGFAANTIYTGVDMTVGWHAIWQTAINRKVITGMPILVFR